MYFRTDVKTIPHGDADEFRIGVYTEPDDIQVGSCELFITPPKDGKMCKATTTFIYSSGVIEGAGTAVAESWIKQLQLCADKKGIPISHLLEDYDHPASPTNPDLLRSHGYLFDKSTTKRIRTFYPSHDPGQQTMQLDLDE